MKIKRGGRGVVTAWASGLRKCVCGAEVGIDVDGNCHPNHLRSRAHRAYAERAAEAAQKAAAKVRP